MPAKKWKSKKGRAAERKTSPNIRRYRLNPAVRALVLNIAESAEITLTLRPENSPDRFVIVLQKSLPTIS